MLRTLHPVRSRLVSQQHHCKQSYIAAAVAPVTHLQRLSKQRLNAVGKRVAGQLALGLQERSIALRHRTHCLSVAAVHC